MCVGDFKMASADLGCKVEEVFGAPRGIRTPGLLVRSQTLYPTELGAHKKRMCVLR